ncbi:MAG TPA: ABC transporter ATP-binding protein, partial [Thermoprotei archaeon]|nr:ABC transporter ATP-binding protein [Thermoprotei archaeon]
GRRYYTQYVAQLTIFNIRNDLYRKLHELSYSFFEKIDTGQIISRATSDIDRVRRFLGFGLTGLFSSILTFSSVFLILFSLNTELTLISLSITPIIFIITYVYAKKSRPLVMEVRQLVGEIASYSREGILGIRVIKAYNLEKYSYNNFLKINLRRYNIQLNLAKLRAFTWPFLTLVVSLISIFVYWYGGLKVMYGGLEPTENSFKLGDLVAFTVYLGMLIWPIVRLGFITVMAQYAIIAAERFFEIIDMEPGVKEKPNAINLKKIRGEIRFENVVFGYDSNKPILKNLNLEIKPGERIAIVGPTGSGKSTLIKLIPRFYDPIKGRILIDGIDLRDVKIRSLRRHIGLVHQDIFLFPGTIRDNIAYGKPNASMDEIIAAAKAAGIHDFIVSLPKGYNTVIGERGIRLSGGQKQRIAIARALLIDPKIIILDDSTSYLDAETERIIGEVLKKLFKGRTVIIITQRPSTIRLADRIVVLSDGRVVEEGSHEELLKKNGLYAKLYMSWFKEEGDE